jgi:hypothetical protein
LLTFTSHASQTSVGESAVTAWGAEKPWGKPGLAKLLQLVSLKCRTAAVPLSKKPSTAQTSVLAAAEMPDRSMPAKAGLDTILQPLPFQPSVNVVEPCCPTTRTSLLATAATPSKTALQVAEGGGDDSPLCPVEMHGERLPRHGLLRVARRVADIEGVGN